MGREIESRIYQIIKQTKNKLSTVSSWSRRTGKDRKGKRREKYRNYCSIKLLDKQMASSSQLESQDLDRGIQTEKTNAERNIESSIKLLDKQMASSSQLESQDPDRGIQTEKTNVGRIGDQLSGGFPLDLWFIHPPPPERGQQTHKTFFFNTCTEIRFFSQA